MGSIENAGNMVYQVKTEAPNKYIDTQKKGIYAAAMNVVGLFFPGSKQNSEKL
jgi:peptide methionine sulfoxide reductase MsrB